VWSHFMIKEFVRGGRLAQIHRGGCTASHCRKDSSNDTSCQALRAQSNVSAAKEIVKRLRMQTTLGWNSSKSLSRVTAEDLLESDASTD
jgi:hypothetical protein